MSIKKSTSTTISKPKFDTAKEFAEQVGITDGSEKQLRIHALIKESLYRKIGIEAVMRHCTIKELLEELIEQANWNAHP